MIEGRRVVVEEAILSGAATVEQIREDMLEALVRQHSRLVYRIAFGVLRRHQEAEDATQETFLRVLRYGSKLSAVDDPKTWLAQIAWRVAVDRSRARHRKEVSLDEGEGAVMEVAASDASAETTVHGAEMSAMVEKLIDALPEKLREPLILSAIEEMTPREMAATLGINEAAVRSRIFRARQILKARLAQRMERR